MVVGVGGVVLISSDGSIGEASVTAGRSACWLQ